MLQVQKNQRPQKTISRRGGIQGRHPAPGLHHPHLLTKGGVEVRYVPEEVARHHPVEGCVWEWQAQGMVALVRGSPFRLDPVPLLANANKSFQGSFCKKEARIGCRYFLSRTSLAAGSRRFQNRTLGQRRKNFN